MTPAVIVAWIMGGSATCTAAFAAWSAWRSARLNAKTTRDVAEQQTSVASYSAQIAAWREDVITLRRVMAEDKAEWERERAADAEERAREREERARERDEFQAHRRECAQKIAGQTEKIAELTRRIEGEARLREELGALEEQMLWMRRDRADQIRRDHMRAAFDLLLMSWLAEWLPRARALGLEVPDPPMPPQLPPLLNADLIDPDPSGPRRRWSDPPKESPDVAPDPRP